MRPFSLIVTNNLTGNKQVVLKDAFIYSEDTIKRMIGDTFYSFYNNNIPFSVEIGYYTSTEV